MIFAGRTCERHLRKTFISAFLTLVSFVWGKRNRDGQGNGSSWQGGGGNGRGEGRTGGNALIPKLMQNRDKITRMVKDYSDGEQHGVTSTTRAIVSGEEGKEISNWIFAHVQEMTQLLENGGRICTWDGFFREISEHYDLMNLDCKQTSSGWKRGYLYSHER